MASPFLDAHQPALEAFCRKFSVKRLYAFGSVVRSDFSEEKSDLDFLVEFSEGLSPEQRGQLYFDLLFALEDYFQRKIDLVMAQPFRNRYFAHSLNQTRELLYAA